MQHQVTGKVVGRVGTRGTVDGAHHHKERHHKGGLSSRCIHERCQNDVNRQERHEDHARVFTETQNHVQGHTFDKIRFHHSAGHNKGGYVQPNGGVT